jgi:signal transduction histidine kinase
MVGMVEQPRVSSSEQDRGRRPTGRSAADRAIRQVLRLSTEGLPRVDFLRKASRVLANFGGCDEVDLWLKEHEEWFHCGYHRNGDGDFCLAPARDPAAGSGGGDASGEGATLHNLQPAGRVQILDEDCWWTDAAEAGAASSCAVVSLAIGAMAVGWLRLTRSPPDAFSRAEVEELRRFAVTFSIILVSQRADAALRERVKELGCLYRLSRLAEQPGVSIEEVLQGIAEMLPPAWQYPAVTEARIVLDGLRFATPGFSERAVRQSAPIVVRGDTRGAVEVCYLDSRPPLDEGPFLREERHLIDAIAREVAVVIERRQVEAERKQLEEQLLHADRLATIGQLAAGVAHELNEPLGGILGFTQLAQKCPDLPDQASQDLGKIEAAALHAREVVKKLMLFGRQTPPNTDRVNLNQVVEDGLFLLEARCTRGGIDIERRLDPALPKITADPGQLHQVLINLVVNALQAMPNGGRLTITTVATGNGVELVVEDTGIGMSEDVKQQVFLPFFTTKDAHEGTGLGLAVVHGIVLAHRGRLRVQSEPGVGTRFEVELPAGGGQDAVLEEGDQ